MNRSVLITGASSGIGRELARLLATEGARLALVARRTERLEALAREIGVEGSPHPLVCTADLADPGARQRVVADVEKAFGRIDVLVNNAGLGELGLFHEMAPAAIQRMIDLNMSALVDLTRQVLPAMVARREGWVLNIASVAAFQPLPLMGVYAATKAFVLSFSEALHNELRRSGVRICCYCPGTTKTEFFERGGFEQHYHTIAPTAVAVEPVARAALGALRRGDMTRIAGLGSAVQVFLTRFFPRKAVVNVAGWILRKLRSSG